MAPIKNKLLLPGT